MTERKPQQNLARVGRYIKSAIYKGLAEFPRNPEQEIWLEHGALFARFQPI
jgi:hypothetical protein